ncbi:HEAT repeat domain-containing protein [Spirochaeta isovalerica]|uniref:HEAT repeat protein n=1 Tax=Spirochaeta isovalerica TaxID=150 RepID=A0A841R597_9SPIO|nr:hypothetical protein [Spirochaeta isovalerica]MBB6478996.1 HEAT repeat protein [Spirochaeta isovalerica]
MKHKILITFLIIALGHSLSADIVSTPLGNRLRQIFPEIRDNYIDLNKNGKLDRLDDMDERISDFLVQDDQLQVQETLEYIKTNYRYFPVRTLESVRDALNSPEGTINELIGLNYGSSISQLIEKRIAMGEYGLYLPPSARRVAMAEMSGFLEEMNQAYKKEGNQAENQFSAAKSSLYSMLEKGYPLPEPMTENEKEILESTLINTLIREQSNNEAVETALYTLGLIRSSRGIPYIIPLVSHTSYSVSSIRSLGAIGNLEALDLLLIALEENPDDNKKIEIIRALGSMGARESLQPLLSILNEEELSEPLLKAVLDSLGKIAAAGTKDRRISAALAEYLNSADPGLRISAVNGLAAFNDQATVASLLGLFKKERSETVLLTLVDRAAGIENQSIVPSLSNLLQNPQTSLELKISCLEAIGNHRDGIKGVNGILAELSSSEPELRRAAYDASKALFRSDSTALTASLARSVNINKDLLFQQQAARLFAELPDEGSINSLLAMLDSEDPEVKRFSTLALYRIRPAGNLRITTALNKMVSNETEPLDVRINAVRALGAAGFDHPSVNVEQTLITAANMRDAKYAQLRYFSLKALGQMSGLTDDSVEKIIAIAGRERDMSIREEAVRTLSSIGIAGKERLDLISSALEKLNPRTNTSIAIQFCELLGEAGNDSFISFAKELKPYLETIGDKRRLAYSFYLSGTDEGYENFIMMGEDRELTDFISSLAESADRELLTRVIERLKRTGVNSEILELTAIIESELSYSS